MKNNRKLRTLRPGQTRSLVAHARRSRISVDEGGKLSGHVSLWFRGHGYESTKIFIQSDLFEAGLDPNDLPPDEIVPVRFFATWHPSEKKNKEGNAYKDVDYLEPAQGLIVQTDHQGTVQRVFTADGDQLYPPISRRAPDSESTHKPRNAMSKRAPERKPEPPQPERKPQAPAGENTVTVKAESTPPKPPPEPKPGGNGGTGDKPAAGSPQDPGTPTEFWGTYNTYSRSGALSTSFNPNELAERAKEVGNNYTWRQATNEIVAAAKEHAAAREAA